MKVQYLLPKDKELEISYLGKVLSDFQTRWLPKLEKNRKYYEGKQNILNKIATDTGKPCNKVVVNYCYSIVKNYLGYLTGIPITYSNDKFQDILDVLNYNDVANEDSELLRNALIYGMAYECNYIDEEAKQRFRLFDSRECVPIYDNSLNSELLYVVRFYEEDLLDEQNQNYIVEVYGPKDVKYYRSGPGFSTFNLISEQPHFYNQCPVTVFALNEDEESIFNQVITLQDAYNELISGSVDDFDAFADAYLVLKGAIAEDKELESMKQNRVLMIDQDADAMYLTKDINNTQIEYLLNTTDEQIHIISNSPNFNDEKFMAQSGEAIKYKLVGFENASAAIEANMRKALQRRIELIAEILSLTNQEEQWRDVSIKFTRNLPNSLIPTSASDLMQYKGLVSDRTLLEQLPFIKNVDEELEEVKKQTEEGMSLYNFKVEEDEEDNIR